MEERLKRRKDTHGCSLLDRPPHSSSSSSSSSTLPPPPSLQVATKVAIDQLLWNPCFGVMFFSYLGLAEGKSVSDIKKKIQQDLSTAVMGSWTVWIPAHFVNFRFVPPSQRLLYINSIQIGYNIFLSFLGNKKVRMDGSGSGSGSSSSSSSSSRSRSRSSSNSSRWWRRRIQEFPCMLMSGNIS